ncbi:copper resistance D family protein [Priestia megaterium]|uniref:copper resistance D family protein n=1 Tax=Priestia megaterium TaxID=1404 RepID=UPI003012F058
MSILLPVFEWFTYVGLSLLLGFAVLQYVPLTKKPTILLSKRWLLASTAAVAIFSVGNSLEIILSFSKIRGLGETVRLVLLETRTGHAWIFVVLIAILCMVAVSIESHPHMYTLLTVALVGGIAYASHAASASALSGMLSHSLHILAVGLWGGVILIVAAFSKETSNWKSFLSWFTPFAIACFVLLSLSGFISMVIIMGLSNYVNSWATDYGQSLLLKHITIIPLLAFAVLNGFLMKKTIKHPEYKPVMWIRAESIILLIIFLFTAIMVTQSPPTNISHMAMDSSILPFIYGKQVTLPLTFHITIVGILFLFVALLFFVYLLICFYKKTVWLSVLSAGLFVFAFYIAMMTSIQV